MRKDPDYEAWILGYFVEDITYYIPYTLYIPHTTAKQIQNAVIGQGCRHGGGRILRERVAEQITARYIRDITTPSSPKSLPHLHPDGSDTAGRFDPPTLR